MQYFPYLYKAELKMSNIQDSIHNNQSLPLLRPINCCLTELLQVPPLKTNLRTEVTAQNLDFSSGEIHKEQNRKKVPAASAGIRAIEGQEHEGAPATEKPYQGILHCCPEADVYLQKFRGDSSSGGLTDNESVTMLAMPCVYVIC